MTDRIVVRPGKKSEALTIAKLFQISSGGVTDYIWHTYEGEYSGLSGVEIGAECYKREEGLFSYQHCLVAHMDGEISGMAHSYVMNASTEPLADDSDLVLRPYTQLKEDTSLYISGLAVFKDFRNQNIGTQLMAVLSRRACLLGCPSMSLLVFEQNEAALRFYVRQGFEEVARCPSNPHPLLRYSGDVLLMRRIQI